MKRLIVLTAASTAAAVAVQQRVQARRAEADLWAQLTDEAPRASTSTPASPAVPVAGQRPVSGRSPRVD